MISFSDIDTIQSKQNLRVDDSIKRYIFEGKESIKITYLFEKIEKYGLESARIQLTWFYDNYNFTNDPTLKEKIRLLLAPREIVQEVIPRVEIQYFVFDKSNVKIHIDQNPRKLKEISIKMDLEEFIKIIETDEFIFKFYKNLVSYFDFKKGYYTDLLKRLENEFNDMKKLMASLDPISYEEKKENFPFYNQSRIFIARIKELLNTIETRKKNLNEISVKKALKTAIMDSEKGLVSIIGRKNIKDDIIANLYAFGESYKNFSNSFNNYAIYGNAGIGKTMIARVIGFVYATVGIFLKNDVTIVTRNELVASYIGQTAPKTRALLMNCLEGILFIDEAYQLIPSIDSHNDFGPESMTEIVNFLDKYIGTCIIIVAGYEKQMRERFMLYNEGMPRRFPNVLCLESYSDRELVVILLNFITKSLPHKYKIFKDTSDFIFTIVVAARKDLKQYFSNQAGDMLNLSTFITRVISSSSTLRWKNDNLENNQIFIMEGFNEFLKSKGYVGRFSIEI